MASRRRERKRKRSRSHFGTLFKLLFLVAVVVALTMGATVFFQVETVTVQGNNRYTEEDIIQAAGIQVGDNLFHMNKYQIANQVLEQLPYTKELNIRRKLPNGIILTVSEWGAVARVVAPPAGAGAPEPEDETSQGDSSSSAQTDPVEIAAEDWLISLGGKLLEPAQEDAQAITVSGITPIMPRAGTLLALPQEEQPKLDGLLAVFEEMQNLEMIERVNAIRLESTYMVVRYLDRFDVKLELNADFNYKLRVLNAAVTETEKKLGAQVCGTFDLTQEGKAAVFSPSK